MTTRLRPFAPLRRAARRLAGAMLLALATHVVAAPGEPFPPHAPPPHPPPPPHRRPTPAEMAPLVRVALAIIEYTRWPGPVRPLVVCIASAGPWGDDLARIAAEAEGPRSLIPRVLPINLPLPPDCDAIVVGGWHEPALRAALADLSSRPVLTIGTGGRFCEGLGQFCLLPGETTSRFSVNPDAVARSGLTVSPRMLQLARPLPSPPPPEGRPPWRP